MGDGRQITGLENVKVGRRAPQLLSSKCTTSSATSNCYQAGARVSIHFCTARFNLVRNSHCIDGLAFFAIFRVYFLSVLFSALFQLRFVAVVSSCSQVTVCHHQLAHWMMTKEEDATAV